VHLDLPAQLYDKTYAEAKRARQSVNDWIRDQIRDAMTRRPPPATPPR
jgi:predicted HicB family RNase H-like nuclease